MKTNDYFKHKELDDNIIRCEINKYLFQKVSFTAKIEEISYEELKLEDITIYAVIIKDSINRLNHSKNGTGVLRLRQWSILLFNIIDDKDYKDIFGTNKNKNDIRIMDFDNYSEFEYINKISDYNELDNPNMNSKINKLLHNYMYNIAYKKYRYLFFNSYVYTVIDIHTNANSLFASTYKFNSECNFVPVTNFPLIKQIRPINQTSYLVNDVRNELIVIKQSYTDMISLVKSYNGELEPNQYTLGNYESIVNDIDHGENNIIIKGMARTGKTVIAMRLLNRYKNAKLLIMNMHFFADLKRTFAIEHQPFPNNRIYAHGKAGFTISSVNSDIIIVDEAQRLSDYEADTILDFKKTNVFLGDDLQKINIKFDRGIETIKSKIKQMNRDYTEYYFTYSIGLPSNVLNTIRYLIDNNIQHTNQYLNKYEIKIYDDKDIFINAYQNDDCFKKHLATIYMGYYDYDYTIGDFKRLKKGEWDKFNYFLSSEIKNGYLITTYELISRELDNVYIYLPNTVSCDIDGLHYYNRDYDEFLKNQIYVLMTRAKCAIHLYCEKKNVRDYFESRLKKVGKFPGTPSNLSSEELQEAAKIRYSLENKGIDRLIHFTSKENLDFIWKYGILSKKELNRRQIKHDINDTLRLDQKPDYISLSVQSPNCYLLNAYKQKYPNKKYVAILLDPSLLYRITNKDKTKLANRIYCNHNAAGASTKKSYDDIDIMFEDCVIIRKFNTTWSFNRNEYMDINEPTDKQAEILFGERIDPSYIIDIEEID